MIMFEYNKKLLFIYDKYLFNKETATYEKSIIIKEQKRENEILNGGSIFWVFKGLILARQKIIGFDNFISEDNILRCKVILDRKIILTDTYHKKPFQGWRYFSQQEAPKDREIFSNEKTQLPLKIEKELSELGIF